MLTGVGTAAGRHRARPNLSALIVLGVIVALLAALYAPVFADFVQAWLTYPEYNYALLVPLTSLFLLWRRWPALRARPARPAARGGLALGAGLIMLLAGAGSGVHVIQGISFIVVVLGMVWFLRGRDTARVALFPVAYLACGLGLYRGLAISLGFTMQHITARYANTLANLLGAPSHRDGLLLTLGHTQFLVATTCSGLSSLLSLLALGWLVVGEGRGTLPYKLLLCLSIGPLALIANIVRVALVLVISQDISPAIADGFVHGLFGGMIFIITLSLLLLIRKVLLWLDRSASLSLPRPS